MGLFIITVLVFGVVMTIMAVGVIFQNKCLRGSCGGEAIYSQGGDMLNCDTCPVRAPGNKATTYDSDDGE